MAKICLKCSLPATKSAVIKGVYYSRLCYNHYHQLIRDQMPSSGQGAYDRGRDVEDHLGDFQQPMHNGKINAEWTKLYPEKARQMFGDDAVTAAERKN